MEGGKKSSDEHVFRSSDLGATKAYEKRDVFVKKVEKRTISGDFQKLQKKLEESRKQAELEAKKKPAKPKKPFPWRTVKKVAIPAVAIIILAGLTYLGISIYRYINRPKFHPDNYACQILEEYKEKSLNALEVYGADSIELEQASAEYAALSEICYENIDYSAEEFNSKTNYYLYREDIDEGEE